MKNQIIMVKTEVCTEENKKSFFVVSQAFTHLRWICLRAMASSLSDAQSANT